MTVDTHAPGTPLPAPARDAALRVSVLVPTFRRVALVAQCLAALERQTRLPDEVVVVMRDDDQPTLDFIAAYRTDRFVVRPVVVPGLDATAARNRGVAVATGDVIAMTDDDAAPRPEWLATACRHFNDPRVGAVGGRDYVHQDGVIVEGEAAVVGRIQWFGRTIGNHHLGSGPARDVTYLKGVNLCYRRTALGEEPLDVRLRGAGAQYGEDFALSLAFHDGGWRVVYDPAVAVDHYPGPLYLSDHRVLAQPGAVYAAVHNETFILLRHLSAPRRAAFLVWGVLVGTKVMPGAAAAVYLWGVQRVPGSFARFAAALRGRRDGWRSWRALPETPPATASDRPHAVRATHVASAARD